MPTPFSFPLTPSPPAPPAPAGSTAFAPATTSKGEVQRAFLGFGLLRPFRRDKKSDFASGGAEELVRSCVGQVLGTRGSNESGSIQGELPWDPEFGSLLETLRHKPNDDITAQMARLYTADALSRWEPRVVLKAVNFSKEKRNASEAGGEDVLVVKLKYALITATSASNKVVLPDIVQTVKV